jgi:hypothetical protein
MNFCAHQLYQYFSDILETIPFQNSTKYFTHSYLHHAISALFVKAHSVTLRYVYSRKGCVLIYNWTHHFFNFQDIDGS